MRSTEIRQKFIEFFKSKDHLIVDSAPIVVKDDPTLMFNNAGMNQFKDYFLGNRKAPKNRIANTQKCLRVSGKHNDLEEVGRDSYHHTMFEMLGNWSFGDYFKKEAISWAWELLVSVYGLDPNRLYATVFSGDQKDGLDADKEAERIWYQFLPKERVMRFDRKDNFWEMGDTGPCGPCSEIHIDLRPDEQRNQIPGKDLVNKDHPQVVEIWNLVFIQYNRKADGSLQELPQKHVDTGMGFERLVMAIQQTSSNYDTDIFRPIIQSIEQQTDISYTSKYDENHKSDIAMRVLADHSRAVAIAIADGCIPSNTGAGYVIRRILRRAVRYYYSYLDCKQPLVYQLCDYWADYFDAVFPELNRQKDYVKNIIFQEEKSFLRTIEGGLNRLQQIDTSKGTIEGEIAFELYDTYGFPLDLTKLIAEEQGISVDEKGFQIALEKQRERSRADAQKTQGDWVVLQESSETEFLGYDQQELSDVRINKFRTVFYKEKPQYQLVLDKTAFYAESGGQVGDTGILRFGDEKIKVLNTTKENQLIIHQVEKLPKTQGTVGTASIDVQRRRKIEANHSATHLLHAALRQILGTHVEQRGSLVDEKHLRFDFSHFQKLSKEEIQQIEHLVNQKIRENIPKGDFRNIPIEEAKAKGAMMLFGEKYGDFVRVISFDENYSIELCGGCHVARTGTIGLFKIIGESSIAAGIRRIEALTGKAAIDHVQQLEASVSDTRKLLKNPNPITENVKRLIDENKQLKKQVQQLQRKQATALVERLLQNATQIDQIVVLADVVEVPDGGVLKNLVFELLKKSEQTVVLLAAGMGNKANIMIGVSQSLQEQFGLHAGQLIKPIAQRVNGGGGGQAHFASAGGSDLSRLKETIEKGKDEILKQIQHSSR